MNVIETNLHRDGSDFYVEIFGKIRQLPPIKIKDLVSYESKNTKVLLGIRTEEFTYDKDSDIKVVFDNVEYMGSDTYGYIIKENSEPIVIRFKSQDPIVIKKEIPISINLENTYLFDIKTEECISYPEKKTDIKNILIEDTINNELEEDEKIESEKIWFLNLKIFKIKSFKYISFLIINKIDSD